MPPKHKQQPSHYTILLPAVAQADQAAALEQLCREAVDLQHDDVVTVFTSNDIQPLMDLVHAGPAGMILYPPHETLVHDLCIASMVQGGFRFMFGVELCCAGEPYALAVPPMLVRVWMAVVESHARAYYSQSKRPDPKCLPYGYRWNGAEIEIEPEHAEQVRQIYQDATEE
jgi:hypothetical protein